MNRHKNCSLKSKHIFHSCFFHYFNRILLLWCLYFEIRMKKNVVVGFFLLSLLSVFRFMCVFSSRLAFEFCEWITTKLKFWWVPRMNRCLKESHSMCFRTTQKKSPNNTQCYVCAHILSFIEWMTIKFYSSITFRRRGRNLWRNKQ